MHLWGSICQDSLPRSNRFRDEMGCENKSKNNKEEKKILMYIFFYRIYVLADLKILVR